MVKADVIMEKVWDYLYESTLQMVVQVEAEEYEMAQKTKNDIDAKLTSISRLLIQKKMTTMNSDELNDQLINTRNKFIKDWYTTLEVPGERHIYNI